MPLAINSINMFEHRYCKILCLKLNVITLSTAHLTAIKSIIKRHSVIELLVFNVILMTVFLLDILFPIMCKINR